MPTRSDEELLAGVVTVISLAESHFATWRGREAELGTLDVVLVGHLKVADNLDPVAVEDAEFALAEEIKAWLSGGVFPAPVRQCVAKEFRQSGQTEPPFGFVTFRLEVMT